MVRGKVGALVETHAGRRLALLSRHAAGELRR